MEENNFTSGKILKPLMSFAIPVFFTLFLQSMYGAVDLIIVGKYGQAIDISAVSTGSQIMSTLTNLITNLAMGTTILIAQLIGEGSLKKAGDVIGTSVILFVLLGGIFTAIIPTFSLQLSELLNAPIEALQLTSSYIRICGIGFIVIIAYNLIGSVFRGMGDSKTPLVTVAIASIINIVGDLLLVGVLQMGAIGAAYATVFAQGFSVLFSFILIKRKQLPFEVSKTSFKLDLGYVKSIGKLGIPVALQSLLVNVSFLIILSIVNNLGLVASSGVGVAEKVCNFIMLVPSAFSHAMSSFVGQNIGARKYSRAKQALKIAIITSTIFGICMFVVGYFKGDLLAMIFTNNPSIIKAGEQYINAYAIDCLFTCFLFVFTGFYNGLGFTSFVMVSGISTAFLVRIPVSYLMSLIQPVSLFRIGLGIPAATVVQIIVYLIGFKKANEKFAEYE